ncbi:MAG: hypothetical protein AUH79_00835 [Betaproteobacteria bacterium 13_1_40CM_4_64_4]|nr:MAG: hypothetical protein AUH79_00835 [Betaproteobacteria bacterium 13_1_40CM_4_64_4]
MVLLPGELCGDRQRRDDESDRGDALAWPRSRYQPPARGRAGVAFSLDGHDGPLPGNFRRRHCKVRFADLCVARNGIDCRPRSRGL